MKELEYIKKELLTHKNIVEFWEKNKVELDPNEYDQFQMMKSGIIQIMNASRKQIYNQEWKYIIDEN